MRHFLVATVSLFVATFLSAQSDTIISKPKKKRGTFYLSWGYTRAEYSRSDIRFVDRSNKYHPITGYHHNYDFTVYNVEATDRNDFHQILDINNFTVPQYVYRIGYYFNNKSDIGVEVNFDHTKYIGIDNQVVRVKGDINGTYVDRDTVLGDILHIEHSDGLNYFTFNLIKRWKLLQRTPKLTGSWIAKVGPGLIVPKTDITIFGERLNNDFKVAGFLVGFETGVRLEMFKYTFIEVIGKGAYANVVNSLVLGKGNGKASHDFFSIQATATLGFQFPFLKNNLK